jgi:hypothetical protein
MENGWIKLPRSVRDSPFWPKARKYTRLEALLDLRFQANYKPGKVEHGGRVIHIPANGLFTSQVWLARRWRWDSRTVHNFFLALNLQNILRIETRRGVGKGYTIVTFLNPEDFEADRYAALAFEEGKNSPSNSHSTPEYTRKEEVQSLRDVSMYKPEAESIEDDLSRFARFEEAAREGDYWELSNGPAESKVLMGMPRAALMTVARVKAVFGKEARVREFKRASTDERKNDQRRVS